MGLDGFRGLWHAGSTFAKIGWVSAALSVIGAVINGFVVSSLGDAAR
jgi:hypothetical protein